MDSLNLSIFLFFRDTELRRRLLGDGSPGSPERYSLFGLENLSGRGWSVSHNLGKRRQYRPLRHHCAVAANRLVQALGERGGDFESVLEYRKDADRATAVCTTVDSIGVPAVLLKHAGLLRPPIIYFSVGLPERIVNIRSERLARLYRAAFRNVRSFVAYGYAEAEWLRSWLSTHPRPPAVRFIPFGVDTDYFRPQSHERIDCDVLSIGADTQRDYVLLVEFARSFPGVSVRMIVSARHLEGLRDVPPNIEVLHDVPFQSIRGHLARGRVVALPVKENSYSGATTTMLQALAVGKPTVVSAVGAVRDGYGLVSGENCVLVPPGSQEDFNTAVEGLLKDRSKAESLGRGGRSLVVGKLSWRRYVEDVMDAIEVSLAAEMGTAEGKGS